MSSLFSSRALLLEGDPGGVPDPMLKIGESDLMAARQLGLELLEPRSTESIVLGRNKTKACFEMTAVLASSQIFMREMRADCAFGTALKKCDNKICLEKSIPTMASQLSRLFN